MRPHPESESKWRWLAWIAVAAHAIPPTLIVLANHLLWPWVTRSDNAGWALWLTAMALIMGAALIVSVLAGLAFSGSRLGRALVIVGGLVAQASFLFLVANG